MSTFQTLDCTSVTVVGSTIELDVLDTFETIKVAVAYRLDGEGLASYPADLDALDRAEVVYKEFPGWQTSTTNCRTYNDLPQKAKDYVRVRYFTWLCRRVLTLRPLVH